MRRLQYRAKELSWLSFNERLLQEANRKEVPLLERLKFLGIYSSNLDEFFRVKVAILKRLVNNQIAETPAQLLKLIQTIVLEQSERFAGIYEDIIEELRSEGIYIVNETELNEEQGAFVKEFCEKTLRAKLMPVILSKKRDLPDLRDAAIYLAVEIKSHQGDEPHTIRSIIEVPTESVPRFIELPSPKGKKCIMILDDLIRYILHDLFFMFPIDHIEAYTIKLTRDAEMDLDDDITQSFMKKVAMGLEKRKEAAPVRFVFDKRLPKDFLELILKKLNFRRDDAVIMGGRYHNFKDFISFPDLGFDHLKYPSVKPVVHPAFAVRQSMFPIIQQKDLMLHIPYHSFLHFIEFLRESSIDPNVKSIYFTIYRVAPNSSVVNTLINAARNGKSVTVIMELQARFNESDNIMWADRLKNEGVKVIFGVHGLKVHSKLCLVERREGKKNMLYAALGTGNFNEDSARVFSDNLLLTAHPGITSEVMEIFNFFNKNYQHPKFNHLWVAPFKLRNQLLKMIGDEIKNAKSGKPAFLYIKVNNLVDDQLISKLYQASEAGVDVRLNVRGMFSLYPKVSPFGKEIPSIGLIDRYLEHSRLYIACNNNKPLVFISSADWMSRNLDARVEVACPIYDEEIKKQLIDFFTIQWNDTFASRLLDNELSNKFKEPKEQEVALRSQVEFYNYLAQLSL